MLRQTPDSVRTGVRQGGLVLLSGLVLLGLLSLVTLGQLQLQTLGQRLQGNLQSRQQLFYQAEQILEAAETQVLAATTLPQPCTAGCAPEDWLRSADQVPAVPPLAQPSWWQSRGMNLSPADGTTEVYLLATVAHQDATSLPGHELLYVELSLQAHRPDRSLAVTLRSQLRLAVRNAANGVGWKLVCDDTSLALTQENDCRRLGWTELG